MKKSELRKFLIIEVDEKNVKIKYDGVLNKRKRPYMVVKNNISQKHFIAVPLTDVYFDKDKELKKTKKKYWLEFNFRKTSYIKLDHLILFHERDLKFIEKTPKFLPNNLKSKSKKLLNELFKI